MIGDRVAGSAQLFGEERRSLLFVMRELRRGMDAVIDLNQVSELVIRPLIQRVIRAKHRYSEKNEQTPKRARHQNTCLQLQRIECSDPSRQRQIVWTRV